MDSGYDILPGEEITWKQPRPDRSYVYALSDPETRAVRYVGITSNPYRRLADHCSETAGGDRLSRWIGSLRPRAPILRVLDVVDDYELALQRQRERIAEHGASTLFHQRHTLRRPPFEGARPPGSLTLREACVALGISRPRLYQIMPMFEVVPEIVWGTGFLSFDDVERLRHRPTTPGRPRKQARNT